MSLHESARWIITYDITDRRRGSRIYRYLKGQGIPIQYSVFVVEASAARMHQLMLELEELIAPSHDDVRAYRWPVHPEVHQLGDSLLPDGMLISTPSKTPERRRRCAKTAA